MGCTQRPRRSSRHVYACEKSELAMGAVEGSRGGESFRSKGVYNTITYYSKLPLKQSDLDIAMLNSPSYTLDSYPRHFSLRAGVLCLLTIRSTICGRIYMTDTSDMCCVHTVLWLLHSGRCLSESGVIRRGGSRQYQTCNARFTSERTLKIQGLRATMTSKL